jgi:predicted extracellular nuclease
MRFSVNQFNTRHSLLLAFLLSLIALPSFGQSGLVISQIYGGGGNSSATFNADFIELYNPTATPISTSGLSVQYASAAGNFTQALALGSATIQPGHYFLVQTIAAGTTGAALPTPDVSGSAPNLSATAGKVALVNSTTAIGTADATCAALLADTKILDMVGYGSTASCYLGSAAAPGPTTNPNNTSVVRTNPTVNTSNNSSDFSLINPPVPHNSSYVAAGALSATGSANPATVTSGMTTLLTAIVTPGTSPASTGISVTANLSSIGGAASQPLYDDGSHGDLTSGDNIFSFSTAATVASSGTVSLPISVTDAQLRSASASISLIVNLPVPTIAIDVIQGTKSTSSGPIVSSYVGQAVQTTGIVTSVITNGFFIQTPDGQDDGNPLTPEGIEVFTSSKPTVAVGDAVTVTGTVQTFPAVTVSHTPATEIASPTVVVNSHSNPLPTPITLSASMLTASGGLYQLTPYEGMRVTVPSMTAISGTNGSISNETSETATTVGYFYAVIDGTARPFREPGIDIRDTSFAGVPANVAHFDDNPERILVNTTISGGSSLEISTGAIVQNVTGVLDFTFSNDSFYDPSRLIVDATWDRSQLTAGITPQPVPLAASNEFTVASFNIERFYNTLSADDLYYVPAGVTGFNGNSSTGTISTGQTFQSAAVDVTSAAYQRRLQKVSLAIRSILNNPDVVTLEEVENQSVAQDIANQINSDAGIANLYSAYSTDNSTYYTQDGTGISVGFLVKNSTVDNLGVSQFGQNESYPSTVAGAAPITLNDRPWLVLNAGIKRASATDYPVTVIVNHMRSLSSINANTSSGANARTKKELQAEDIAKYIQGLQASGKHVISGGDFNAFEFSDGYTDTLATYTNVNVLPADQVVVPGVAGLVTPPLVDLTLTLPVNQRWSYVEDGSAQVLDHMVVTPELATGHITYAHIDADFPLTAYNDATTPARTSDHDPVVGYFAIPAPVASATLTPPSGSFGSFTIGTSSSGQVFTFTNTGEADIAISSIATTGDFAVSNNCPAVLIAGAFCSANVVFTPTASGPRSGALNITTNLSTPVVTAQLSGTGVDAQGNPVLVTTAVLTASGSNYSATVTIKNNGTGTAHNVTITTATLGSASGTPIPASLGDILPGASATATVVFPSSAGAPGAATAERYTGTYTGGTFGASIRATLPISK